MALGSASQQRSHFFLGFSKCPGPFGTQRLLRELRSSAANRLFRSSRAAAFGRRFLGAPAGVSSRARLRAARSAEVLRAAWTCWPPWQEYAATEQLVARTERRPE